MKWRKKVEQLFPDEIDRGLIIIRLIGLDKIDRLECFNGTDSAIQATLRRLAGLDKRAANVSTGCVTSDYCVSPVGPANFAFDLSVPPIYVTKYHTEWTDLPERQIGKLSQQGIMIVGSTQSSIAFHFVSFLGVQTLGDSEDALHGRDDSLFHIIEDISGMRAQRVRISEGNSELSRLDVLVGQPPVVLTKEKDTFSKLSAARSECLSEFAWTPHYALLPFVVGVAITDTEAEFFTFDRQCVRIQKNFNLRNAVDRGRCVQAAINTARYLKYVEEHYLLPAMDVPIYKPLRDWTLRRYMFISWKEVTKHYLRMDSTDRRRLMRFYLASRDVPHLEKYITIEEKDGELRLRLQPVGLQRMPNSLTEAKMAIMCVLRCLAGCHRLGWALNDVRWPNIVLLNDKSWCVIDAELACEFGSPLPSMRVCPPEGENHLAAHHTDLYMVKALVEGLVGEVDLDADLLSLKQALSSMEKRKRLSAKELLNLPWIESVASQLASSKESPLVKPAGQLESPASGPATSSAVARATASPHHGAAHRRAEVPVRAGHGQKRLAGAEFTKKKKKKKKKKEEQGASPPLRGN